MQNDDETNTFAAPAAPSQPPGESRPLAPLQVRDRGRYQVIAEHGRGGIGRVLRATDREFGRDVAVKELLIRTPSSEMRFMREALITARLEHPNIVPVHEAGRWDDGTPFYAMKLVAGRPLKALIAEAKTYPERLKLLERVLAVTDAIAYAHDRGVIHRDLKPSNIIVGDYGETIVIDWGLAKAVGDTDDGAGEASPSASPDLTVAGAVLGTPAYMAPEQAAGGDATARSDVYALGAIVRDILRGGAARPVATAGAEASGDTSLQDTVSDEFDGEVTDTPADLRSVVRRAMAMRPADRYESARVLGDELRRFLTGAPVDAHRYSARERSGRWLSAHRRLTTAALGVMATLFVASVVFLAREARLRDAAESASEVARTARQLADEERSRADRQTQTLLEEQARSELDDKRPFRAATLLINAYTRDASNLRIRWLLTDAVRSVEALQRVYDVRDATHDSENLTYAVWPSQDGSTFLTGHMKDLAAWDAQSGLLLNRWRTPAWRTNLVRYNNEESLILNITVPTSAGVAKTLDPRTGNVVSSVPVEPVADYVIWSSDARWVAAVHPTGRLEIWSATNKRIARVVMLGAAPLFGSIAFSPDGLTIAARGRDELVAIDVLSGNVRRVPSRSDEIQVVAYSPSGRLIATTMSDRSVQIWDANLLTPKLKLASFSSLPILVSFSADSSLTAVITSDGIGVFDVHTGTQIVALDEQTRDQTIASTWSHSGARLFTVSMNGYVRVWDFTHDKWARSLPVRGMQSFGVFTKVGGIALLEMDELGSSSVQLWDDTAQQVLHRSTISWRAGTEPSFAADGGVVAAMTSDNRVSIFETSSGRSLFSMEVPDLVSSVALSPDGQRLAVRTLDGTLRIVSPKDQSTNVTLPGQPSRLGGGLSFSPNGDELAWGSGVGTSEIVNARSGQRLFEIPRRGATLSYSSDGTRLLVTGTNGDDVPTVWHARTGQQISSLESGGAFIQASALNADGTLAATAADLGDVRVWETATGRLLRSFAKPARSVLAGHDARVRSVSFSPDSKRLLTTFGSSALVWNIEVDERSAEELSTIIAEKSPWRLVNGRLKLPD